MDLIDREQAIYMLRANRPSMPAINKETKSALQQFYRDLNAIEKTPSARKTGHWIKFVENFYACSVCNAVMHTNFNYCPSCGAIMEAGNEDLH